MESRPSRFQNKAHKAQHFDSRDDGRVLRLQAKDEATFSDG